MKQLDKKLGPLKLWQWLAIGGTAGVALYLYNRNHQAAKVNPEEEEKLLGALRSAGSGGGGEGGAVAAPGPIGIVGEPGIAGPQGSQGPAGESVNLAPIEASISSLEHQLATNNPPTVTHNTAAQAKGRGVVKNSKGESYRTVTRNGKTFHEYPGRTGPSKMVLVGAKPHGQQTGHAAKPKPAKRPKPKPIHQRVSVHPPAAVRHAAPAGHPGAHAHAAPAPVHHKPAPHKAPAKRKRG